MLRQTKIAILKTLLFGILLETILCLAFVFILFRSYPLFDRIMTSFLTSLSISNICAWIFFFNMLEVPDNTEEENLVPKTTV